ncbi:MAG: hypothetical protein ACKV2T_04110 [Kofleriaceae bacterium]
MTPAQVLERVFTSDNPVTGSKPPPAMAWVIFANGTCFYSAPSDALPVTASRDEIEAAGKAALRELGPVHVGSPSADFNPARLDGWFPDDPVWFVTFDHAAIATILVAEGNDLAIGLRARSLREDDHDEQRVVLVRGFDGTSWT